MKSARGFTLVEVLVVVVIVTVLATIGTLTYGGFQSQSRDSKREANANVIADSLERYYEKNGEYPSIADVTSTNTAQVKTLLNISDTSALVMPNAPPSTTNSLKAPTETPSPSVITYNARIADSADNTPCQQTGGGCDSFTLTWQEEAGEVATINSRNQDRVGILQAPPNPIMTASIVSGTVVGKVTHNNGSSPVCSLGTPEYKIISSTTDITPNWSTESWQPTDSKTISSPTASTEYFFYAIARCSSPDGGEAENTNVAKDSFYYTVATMSASWSGTTAIGTISSGTSSPICQPGQTAQYLIQNKIDTASSFGSWSTLTSWSTTNNVQIPANGTNPRKISFKGQVRCNDPSPAPVGTPYPESNTDFVISAPTTPVVTRTSTYTTANWDIDASNSVVCPRNTASTNITPTYTASYGGNFSPKPYGGGAFTPSADGNLKKNRLVGVFQNGFSYEFGVRASCGAISSKILGSSRTSDTIAGSFASIHIGSGRFFTADYSGSSNRVRGRAIVHSDSAGYCPTGTNRYITGQFQHNSGGVGTDSGAAWYTNFPTSYWPSGDLTMQSGQILAASVSGSPGNDTMEFRAEVYCHNPTLNTRSNPEGRYIDRFGVLFVHGYNEGGTVKPYRYRILCNGQSLNGNGIGTEWLYCESGPNTFGAVRDRNTTW